MVTKTTREKSVWQENKIVNKSFQVENQPNGLGNVGLPLGSGEEGETDRQRPPSLRGPSGPVAISAEEPMIFIVREGRSIGEGRKKNRSPALPAIKKRIAARQSLAVLFGLPRPSYPLPRQAGRREGLAMTGLNTRPPRTTMNPACFRNPAHRKTRQ